MRWEIVFRMSDRANISYRRQMKRNKISGLFFEVKGSFFAWPGPEFNNQNFVLLRTFSLFLLLKISFCYTYTIYNICWTLNNSEKLPESLNLNHKKTSLRALGWKNNENRSTDSRSRLTLTRILLGYPLYHCNIKERIKLRLKQVYTTRIF